MADGDSGTGSSSIGETSSDSSRKSGKKDDDRKSGIRGGLKSAGSSLLKSGQDELGRVSSERITPVSMRKGGKVRNTKRKQNRRSKTRE